jgi:DNA-binding CsgD family transcriptional regulator
MLPFHFHDRPTPAPHSPHSSKAKATWPPGKAPAQRLKSGCVLSASLPLSFREQQVLACRNQGLSFEDISDLLCCSPRAIAEYYRCALAKLQTTITNSPAPLEQVDRKATAKAEPAIAEPPRDCPTSALASIRTRTPFHSPAVDASALLERSNPLDLFVSSLFIKGEPVANPSSRFIDVKTCTFNLLEIPESFRSLERSPDQSKVLESDEFATAWDFVVRRRKLRTISTHFSQTTIIDPPPRQPRKRSSRCSRRASMGFLVAVAS